MHMHRNTFNLTTALLLVTNAVGGLVVAADVTPERLLNVNLEPQNWLMNHRTYDGQRFSPLARINASNVRGLKLAYAVPLAGATGSEYSEATPLVEDGFIYVTDSWGVLYKIDGTSGDVGRIVWRMDPKQEKQANNRGAAFWGNLVISPANWPARIIAVDKDSGKIVWETNVSFGQPELRITGAPLAIKDKLVVGASGGDSARLDRGPRRRDWQGAVAQVHHSGAWRTRQ
jgi:alcohol dehydrogenase (cytochrome c)